MTDEGSFAEIYSSLKSSLLLSFAIPSSSLTLPFEPSIPSFLLSPFFLPTLLPPLLLPLISRSYFLLFFPTPLLHPLPSPLSSLHSLPPPLPPSSALSKAGCKQRELTAVVCPKCGLTFCLSHRHPPDHDCVVYQEEERLKREKQVWEERKGRQ